MEASHEEAFMNGGSKHPSQPEPHKTTGVSITGPMRRRHVGTKRMSPVFRQRHAPSSETKEERRPSYEETSAVSYGGDDCPDRRLGFRVSAAHGPSGQ